MANIKQQVKRIRTNEAARQANMAFKSSLRTAIKKVLAAVEEGNKEAATAAYNVAASSLDGAVSKGIYHKNYASRQKSRLAKLVNSIEK